MIRVSCVGVQKKKRSIKIDPFFNHPRSLSLQDDVGAEAEGTPELAAARDAVATAEAKLAEAA